MMWLTPGTSMPRATMSVATKTRTWPLRKAFSARWRAFCALLPWIASAAMPSLPRFCTTRSAPCLVRAKTITRRTSGAVTSAASRARLAAVSTTSRRCSTRSTVVACGATSTRTGSLRKPWARLATSAGMVAENSADCRRGCSAATIFRTGWMKPMSSMRSASSSTTQRVWSSRIERSSIRSVSRPGVATTTSTPRAIARTWALRDMPPRISSVVSRAPPAKLRNAVSICTASSRVGARTSARQVLGAGRPVSASSWCRIGSAKAAVLPVPVWAMPRMSRPASCGAIAWAWIGVGVSKPARASASVSGAARPKPAKSVCVTSIPFRAAVAAAAVALVRRM